MRQIFLDTETTGFEFKEGHRIIEFGAVEMVDRKLTGNNLHFYFKPDIEVEAGAFRVHGVSNEFLQDKPLIGEKFAEMMDYLTGAEVIIHNAGFDVPFLNWELGLLKQNPWGKLEDHCQITDSLTMAREKHPGQKNSLDALCSRYGVSNKHRTLHGALLDAEILAEVYLMMTGGQIDLFSFFAEEPANVVNENQMMSVDTASQNVVNHGQLLALYQPDVSMQAHEDYLQLLDEKSNNQTLWRKLSH